MEMNQNPRENELGCPPNEFLYSHSHAKKRNLDMSMKGNGNDFLLLSLLSIPNVS